jgi:hypothetical protein
MEDPKPQAVIPENLSEMSPQTAWNLALATIAPLAEWDSFWNDGLDIPFDIEKLTIKETTDDKPKFRYRGNPRSRRLVSRQQGLYSWRFRHPRLRGDEAEVQHSSYTRAQQDQEELDLWPSRGEVLRRVSEDARHQGDKLNA